MYVPMTVRRKSFLATFKTNPQWSRLFINNMLPVGFAGVRFRTDRSGGLDVFRVTSARRRALQPSGEAREKLRHARNPQSMGSLKATIEISGALFAQVLPAEQNTLKDEKPDSAFCVILRVLRAKNSCNLHLLCYIS